MTKYYIVETHYIGPESQVMEYSERDRFEITTKPPQYNGREVCLNGYIGTYGNVDRYAYGSYDSLAAAEYAVVNSLGCGICIREPEEDLPQGVLAIYRKSSYVSRKELRQWLETMIDISADDTDEDLERLTTAMIYEMQEEGCTVTHDRMLSALETLRDNARGGIDD